MKRLALFLVGAMVVFELSYALQDTRMFFGTDGPAPVAGQSDRPGVEAALARFDAALAQYYATGEEGPLRAVLADPDNEGSPLHGWREDRHAWIAAGGAVPVPRVQERTVREVSVFGLDTVSASAVEVWLTAADGGAAARGVLAARYRFRRGEDGLRLESVGLTP